MRRLVLAVTLALALCLAACGDDGGGAVGGADTPVTVPDAADASGAVDSGGEVVFCGTCDRKECGTDGCGNPCGTCGAGEECLQGACVATCAADCAGRDCGDDGCGGSCGACGAAEICAAGLCSAPCEPQCDGVECGDNGCGGSCGDCPTGEQCFGGACMASCTPDCAGRGCGGDGCGGTCGACGADETCAAGRCVASCTPQCDGVACGDNGCGGVCGTCADGTFCVAGACAAECTPDCAGSDCGDDGCGGSCGDCPAGEACLAGTCSDTCAPDCAGRQCGDDGCGGSCGTCGAGESCAAGTCAPICTPDCAGKQCGDNGCGGSCGACADGAACVDGACVAGCEPACDGRECGPDGCGGSCGTCGAGEGCADGVCAPICAPTCEGRACGDNGCGGSCGTCEAGFVCADFQCAAETQLVDWCRFQWPREATVEVGKPLTLYVRVHEAGITDRTNGVDGDPALRIEAGVAPDGAQAGTDAWGGWTVALPNDAWTDAEEPGNDEYMATVSAPATVGAYDLAFRATVDDGSHWVWCDLPSAAGDGSADGYQPANAAALTTICVPDCGERVCGDDGCGGDCGTCAPGASCEGGACVAGANAADWCRLQYPLGEVVAPGATFTAYVRVYEAGVTDRSDAVDPDPSLVVRGGIGPDGAAAVVDDWPAWVDAAPNTGWDAVEGGEPNNDEYQVDLVAPEAEGDYDLAFIASADGGATWTWCDGNGSADGYAPELAGALVVEAPCEPDCEGRACGWDGCTGSCGECGANAECVEGRCVDLPPFGWCRYQWPTARTALAGESFTAYVRVHVEGVTDRTTGTDTSARLGVAHAVLPDGADPENGGGATVEWTPASPNEGWSDTDEPGNDEYLVTVAAPATAGSYDMVFRVTFDGARTMDCDTDAGPGSDGSEDGYQPENAAALVVE